MRVVRLGLLLGALLTLNGWALAQTPPTLAFPPEPPTEPTAPAPTAPPPTARAPTAPPPNYQPPLGLPPGQYVAPPGQYVVPPGQYVAPPADSYPPLAPLEESSEPPSEARILSLTLSPLHLLLPIFEVEGELRVHDHFSVAGIFGIGTLPLELDTSTTKQTVSTLELGAQLAFYPLQEFEGLLLGAELLWVRLDLKSAKIESATVSGYGEGLGLGPMVGYKLITGSGFTFVGQVGAQYFSTRAQATDTVTTQSSSQSGWIPLINLNVGWSF